MDKKRIIKALSVLLCAVMLVGYVPAAAFAQTEEIAEPAVEETSIEEIPEAVENELIDAPAEAQEVGADTEQLNPETEETQTESEKEAEVVYSE